MKIRNVTKKSLSVLLILCLILPCLPVFYINFGANAAAATTIVVDPSGASNYHQMLGTGADGNRYSGRVWFDKSLFAPGDEAKLPLHDDFTGLATDTIKIDSSFMVVGSALGSTTSVTTTTSTAASIDVVLILDNSTSMYEESNNTSRLEKVVSAANSLIKGITSGENNRLAIVAYSGEAETLLPLNYYKDNDSVLSISTVTTGSGWNRTTNHYYTASATPVGSSEAVSETFSVSQWGTNVQIGVDMGMKLLSNASDTSGRVPVVILLTDGVSNVASTRDWYAPTFTNRGNHGNPTNQYVSFATLLTAAYGRSRITANYGKAPTVYGIGVDLTAGSDASVVMDPANYLKPTGSNVATNTYALFEQWKTTNLTFSYEYDSGGSEYTWRYEQLPSNYPGTKQDIIDNINYVDKYYPIGSEEISEVFDEILIEINEKAFVPLVDKVVQGEIEVDTPLTYIDYIGDYMEVKEFKAVTLFGKIYSVSKSLEAPVITDAVNGGTVTRTKVTKYIVESDTVTNEVAGVTYDISEALKITVTDIYTVELNENGVYERTSPVKQEVRATIPSTALPLIYDKVVNNDGEITYETNRGEVVPLRLYYTVDMVDEILDANGNVITDLLSEEYLAKNTNPDGTVNFYAGQYGVVNSEETINGVSGIYKGDSHAEATPSVDNRFYYYQNNYPVYITATDKNGNDIVWDADEYGVLYYQGNGIDRTLNDEYKTEYLLYSQVEGLSDTNQVYTMVGFYRPTTGGAGEAVGYLVYTDWQYLKDSLAYYDNVNGVYINGFEDGAFVTSETDGYNVDTSVVDAYIAANGLEKSDITCVLGVDTWRTSRLHNMIIPKTDNPTGTAEYAVYPTHNVSALHDGSLVSWLGNNGKMSVIPQQGISVSKTVTQAVSGAETQFEITVTIDGIDFTPAFLDTNGNALSGISVVKNNSTLKTIVTLNLSANETVYITNLPTGAKYTVSEKASNYYTPAYTNEAGVVAANTLTNVSVVNTPKAYGNLIISKEVIHPFGGNLDNEFDFVLTINGLTQWEIDNVLSVPAGATVTLTGNVATVTGIRIKDGASATVSGIPVGAGYVVQELAEAGFTLDAAKTTGTSGVISETTSYADFVNTYDPHPPVNADITVSGTKTLTANATEDWTFTFKVQKLNGTVYEDVAGATASVNLTSTGTKDYTISLAESYTTIGTHYYRVVEEHGTDPAMTYDTVEGLFKVTVSDPGVIDGVLVVDVETVSDSTVTSNIIGGIEYFTVDVDFYNLYDANGTHAELNIQKILNNNTGVSVPLNIFSFELKQGGAVIHTAHTDASGKAVIAIPIDAEGTYQYTLSEVNSGKPGMTYDTTVYNVTVKAEDEGGHLVATLTIEGVSGTTATFTNTYTLDPVSVIINGNKILQNKTLAAGQFSFEIYETDDVYHALVNGYTDTVSNASSGAFSFELPQYTKAGTYRYVIKEIIPAAAQNNLLDGITYDDSVYHVTVTVTDDGNGKLASSVQISKLGAGSVADVTFTNVYKAVGQAQLTFQGEKTLNGRNLYGSEFTFVIEVEKDGVALPDVHTTNLSTGKIQFPTFTYTEADIGSTFVYRVYESVPTGAVNNVYEGVTYTKVAYSVSVSVKDNGVGGITLDVLGDYEELDFTNTYEAQPVKVGLDGVKTLNGRDMVAGEFEFVLKNSADTAIETVSNKADGTFTFADLTFTSAGVYTYTVSEVKGSKGGVTYDETVYTVTVTVTDNGKGILTASTLISGSGSLSFTNIYNTENVAVKISGTKALTGKPLEAGEFTFAIYRAIIVDGKFEINGDEMVTATNDENGDFVFPDGVFTAPVTAHYIIKELNDGKTGVTYDDTVYNMTITVTDNGEGKLVADVAVTDINGNKTDVEFNNVFTPADLPVSFGGTKQYNKALAAGDFSFQLKDEGGNVLKTVSNDVNGNFKFDVVYTASDIGKTFKYTVSEVNGGKGGVTYDTTVYEFSVSVVNENGLLVANVSGANTNALNFSNSYGVKPVQTVISGTKTLNGRNMANGEFEFILRDSAGNLIESVSNNGTEIKFAPITYVAAGTYTYTVSEVIPANALSGVLDGVTYDDTVYTVTITVTDNGAGKLVATVDGGNAIAFKNTYSTAGATVTLDGTKTLTGRDIIDGEFKFLLKDKDGNTVGEAVNAGKAFAFGTLTFDKVGTYTYTVSEVTGDKGGVTYDDTVYTVTVTVTDDGNGKLVADVKGGDSIAFTNVYNTEDEKVVIGGSKVLTGRDIIDGEFKFSLKDSEGNVVAETVNAGNSFVFEALTFDKVGTYTYTVSEIKGDKGGVTYDDTVYTVTVTVADNGNGKLVATVTGADAVTFTNSYAASSAEVVLSGSKVLVGRDIIDGEFAFVIKDSAGNVVAQTVNAGDKFTFDALTFDKVGEYVYTVIEVKGDKGGVTYDATVYTVKVTVTDDGNGKLVATAAGNESLKFTNNYASASVNVTLNGTKTLEGRDLAEGEFQFLLKDSEGTLLQTVTNDANGLFGFEPVEFVKVGEYVYTVIEVKGDKGGVTYDATVYTVKVTVTDDGNGKLVAAVEGGDAINFNNLYSASGVTVTLSGIKNLVGKELAEGMFSFNLKDKDGNVLQTVTNKADGVIDFTAMEFDKAGEYVYTVTEVIGTESGMSYDETVYTVKVTVTDDGNGKLVADVTVSGDGVIEFNNEYVPDTPQLGDESNTFILYSAMLVSVIGLAVLVFKKRKAE
ncbi:MAG: VWA domain-containing protein [Clostridia bacterium]|nr:VWA domain-containing protein [Clostridia bacterium]